MVPPGRKRFGAHFPAHIDPEKLPERVEYITKGEGFWRMAYKDDTTGKWRYKRLCGAQATLGQIHQALEANQKPGPAITFKALSLDFQKSLKWRELSPLTQEDYRFCHKKICAADTGKLPFGDQPISKWTTGTVLKYRDFRGEDSRSRANKELAYIKRVLAWAKLYELIAANPADGVPKLTVKPRKHYTEDKDFNFFLQVARESGCWYLAPLMRISYECDLRLCEAVALTDDCEKPDGLRIVGRKGGNTNIVKWGGELRQAWDEAKAKRNQIIAAHNLPRQISPDKRWLFISERTGDRLTEGAVKIAKNKVDKQAKAKAAALGIPFTHFTLHDVKKKGVTDGSGTAAQKMDKSRHKNLSMVALYDLSEKRVNPTSED